MRDRYPHLSVVFAVLFVLSLAAVATVVAAVAPIYTAAFSQLAVGGYDPIAYFDEGEPVKGSKDHETTWRGATWRFTSAENLDRFVADPEAFAPQYGGYCAYAVAKGSTAKGDPQHWAVVDGKLYLNYNRKIMDRWKEDVPGYVEAADKNWPALLDD